MQTVGWWVSTKQVGGELKSLQGKSLWGTVQEQFLLQLCPNYPPCSFLSQSVHQQVDGPSVRGLVLAEENEKVRLVVYILGEHAPTAELDITY